MTHPFDYSPSTSSLNPLRVDDAGHKEKVERQESPRFTHFDEEFGSPVIPDAWTFASAEGTFFDVEASLRGLERLAWSTDEPNMVSSDRLQALAEPGDILAASVSSDPMYTDVIGHQYHAEAPCDTIGEADEYREFIRNLSESEFERVIESYVQELNDEVYRDDVVSWEETPALTKGRTEPPSGAAPPTPVDDPSSSDTETRNLKGKQRADPEEATTATQNVSDKVNEAPKKRKRSSREVDSDGRNDRPNNNVEGTESTPARNSLSVEFIRFRFEILAGHDPSVTWPCPFPTRAALKGGKCLPQFTADEMLTHVRDHMRAFERKHPGGRLPCPKGGEDDCKWNRERKPSTTTGPNDGLPRHLTQKHLGTNKVRCCCGSMLVRDTLDQLGRHLCSDSHYADLERRRREDPSLPDRPRFDDPSLLEEERLWWEAKGAPSPPGPTEEDRGEGSSTGRKRARRS